MTLTGHIRRLNNLGEAIVSHKSWTVGRSTPSVTMRRVLIPVTKSSNFAVGYARREWHIEGEPRTIVKIVIERVDEIMGAGVWMSCRIKQYSFLWWQHTSPPDARCLCDHLSIARTNSEGLTLGVTLLTWSTLESQIESFSSG